MLLMIDNYDSFTYNLYQYLSELGAEVEVARNDKISLEEIQDMSPDGIIISPGIFYRCGPLAFPGAHIKGGFVDMGEGHQLELIQYLSPVSGENNLNRNDLGASHLAFFVEDLDRFYQETSQKGIKYNNPPASMFDDNGRLSRKAAYAQDPDGNWLEFVETF